MLVHQSCAIFGVLYCEVMILQCSLGVRSAGQSWMELLLFQGGKEFLMRAHFGLPSVENNEMEGRPPITVNFEIPYFTVSGIQVCLLALAKSFASFG